MRHSVIKLKPITLTKCWFCVVQLCVTLQCNIVCTAHMLAHTHTHTHKQGNSNTHTHTHTQRGIQTHTNTQKGEYKHTHTHEQTNMQMYMHCCRAHMHAHTHRGIQNHTHTHIHTFYCRYVMFRYINVNIWPSATKQL